MASYAEWCELEERFWKLHEQEPRLRADSFECGSHWQVRGNRGDGRVQFNSLARRAAIFAGCSNTEGALDWWLVHLKSYLQEQQSKNLSVLLVYERPAGQPKPPPEEMRCKEEFLINPVCESSAIYCQHWANQARLPEEARKRRKPGKKADPKIKLRSKIVRKHIGLKSDFYDPDIFHALLSELDYDRIPPPIAQGKPIFVHRWVDVQDDEFLVGRVIKILNEDRWD